MQAKKIRKNYYACKLLQEYLEEKQSNLRQFAKKLKCNYMTVWGWSHGLAQPSLKFAVLIEEKTFSQVPCKAWLILDKGSEPKNAKKKKPSKCNDKTNPKSLRGLKPVGKKPNNRSHV